jgi:tRNA-5-methyluridine54 2-sulfurtransferase
VKCRRCKAPAVVDVRRHNAAFCRECFLHHMREQVRRAIDEHDMLVPGERVLVAVSGGKDSLAAWDLLRALGYDADGLYIGLGIGDYSDSSGRYAREFAEARQLTLHTVDLARDFGYDVPGAAVATRRAPCGACGLSKRHLFNEVARERGYDVVVTGHNLDDEAAVLLGNVLRWETGYLGRQYPVLPASDGFVRKVKPLVRLGERETAAYCVLTGIDYIVEECPMAAGNRHLGFKEMLNALEDRSPGSKAAFLFGFFERGHERFAADASEEREELRPCRTCGSPTTGEVCSFCALRERATVSDEHTIDLVVRPTRRRSGPRRRPAVDARRAERP